MAGTVTLSIRLPVDFRNSYKMRLGIVEIAIR